MYLIFKKKMLHVTFIVFWPLLLHPLYFSLSLSLTHTHTHTHTHTRTRAHAHTHDHTVLTALAVMYYTSYAGHLQFFHDTSFTKS